MNDERDDDEKERPDRPKTFEIKIDRMTYKVREPVLTGAQLRSLQKRARL